MSATLDTFTTLKRTPGMSPSACPERPKPEISTSSFSSMKLSAPSLGQKLEAGGQSRRGSAESGSRLTPSPSSRS